MEAGGIIAGSMYGQDGVGVQGNWHILGPIGEVLTTYKRPFLLGSDWNIEPEELCSSGWVARLGAVVVKPQHTKGTCRTTGGLDMYDFFVMSESLCHRVAKCTVHP